jgi:uncharacterized protein
MRQVGKLVVLQVLRGYKWAISPIFPPACRFVPTCSEYAMEAVERYGAVRGGVMALWRVLRCHPFAAGGYDPVLRVGAGYGGATTLPQGLKPALIEGDSSQRLKRCATQNLSRPGSSPRSSSKITRATQNPNESFDGATLTRGAM